LQQVHAALPSGRSENLVFSESRENKDQQTLGFIFLRDSEMVPGPRAANLLAAWRNRKIFHVFELLSEKTRKSRGVAEIHSCSPRGLRLGEAKNKRSYIRENKNKDPSDTGSLFLFINFYLNRP
jgi:hypothetical protein